MTHIATQDEQTYFDINRARLASMPKIRLEYLREQIQKECISYGEIVELQTLRKYIQPGDVELLQWAGVKEKI